MIYIYLKDDIHFKDIKTNNTFALLSSINATTDVKEPALSNLYKRRPLHKLLRYNQFVSFSNQTKLLIDKVDDMHLKYGGMCFLWGDNPNCYKKYIENVEMLFNYDYIVDPLNNNSLLDRSDNLATIDKLVLNTIFKYKDSKLLYYRPIDDFIEYKKEDIVNTLKDATPDDIRNSPLFTIKIKNPV